MSKLLENTFRAVNISLVNEIKIICDKVGLNVHKVINLAKKNPMGSLNLIQVQELEVTVFQ